MKKTEFQNLAEAIAKSGDIAPGSLNIGGALRPERASRLIDLIVDSANILKMVTVERSKKLSKEIDVFAIGDKILTRIPQGRNPDEFAPIENVGPMLEMKAHQLFGRVLFDALRDNKDDPKYETKVLHEWAKAWGRNIARLAFTGTHDDYSVDDSAKKVFERLNVGWPQLLKNAAASHKVDKTQHVVNGAFDYIGYFEAIVGSLPDEYKSEECRLIISKTDHEGYVKQIGAVDGGLVHLIKGDVHEFLGYKIIPHQYMLKGEVMFTPLPNLVYGVNTEIERYREVSGRKRCVDYTFDANSDFQVAIPKAAVIGYARS